MPREVHTVALRAADGVRLAADLWPTATAAPSAVVLAHGFGAHRRDPAVLASNAVGRFPADDPGGSHAGNERRVD